VLAHALNTTARPSSAAARRRGRQAAAASTRARGRTRGAWRAFTNRATTSLQHRTTPSPTSTCRGDRLPPRPRPRLLAALPDGLAGPVASGAGRWDAAGEAARAVLSRPGAAATSLITPLVVVARLRARRGDPTRGRSSTRRRSWPRRPAAATRTRGGGARRGALARGETELVGGETERALALALENGDSWAIMSSRSGDAGPASSSGGALPPPRRSGSLSRRGGGRRPGGPSSAVRTGKAAPRSDRDDDLRSASRGCNSSAPGSPQAERRESFASGRPRAEQRPEASDAREPGRPHPAETEVLGLVVEACGTPRSPTGSCSRARRSTTTSRRSLRVAGRHAHRGRRRGRRLGVHGPRRLSRSRTTCAVAGRRAPRGRPRRAGRSAGTVLVRDEAPEQRPNRACAAIS
jgi:hypothetical protein